MRPARIARLGLPEEMSVNVASKPVKTRSLAVFPGLVKTDALPPTQVVLAPAVITLLLWISSPNQIALAQGIAAFLLLLFAWWSYWRWRQSGHRGLPLLSGVMAMYWLYFGLQLFWGDRKAPDWRHIGRTVGDAAISETMLLVLCGVFCLWLGSISKLGRRVAPRGLPEISFSWKAMTVGYLQGIAVVGTVMSRYDTLVEDEGLRQVMSIIESTVSITAIVILLRRVLEGKAGQFEKIMLSMVLVFRIVMGISSGWMGSAVALILVCAAVYLQKRRKLPLTALACLLPYVLFFQAGKAEFRRAFWYSEMQASEIEKVEYWVDASLKRWERALDDPSGAGVAGLLALSLSRTSLLTHSANVLELTPSVVPYQYGRLYSYLAVSLIPRYFWPDKASVSDANRFYQVAYGVTRESDLGHISIAVGVLTEGYINFSWWGTAAVMFLVGVLLDFWNETFLTRSGSLLAAGIGIALIPQLLMVETQMAQYVSGLVQQVLLTFLVLLPIVRWRKSVAVKPARSAGLRMAGARSG